MDYKDVLAAHRKHEKNLRQQPNVIGVGCGYKIKNGVQTNELCVVVAVTKKIPPSRLAAQQVVPMTVEGVTTDVIEIGVIRAFAIDPTQRYRPPVPGCSIGHYQITAGTLGCIVKKGGKEYILSNNHVLANSNSAAIGDPIYQPGVYDGGTSDDTVANLSEFVQINFDGTIPVPPPEPPKCPWAKATAATANAAAKLLGRKHRLVAVGPQADTTNYVDAAIALPTVPVSCDIPEIGLPVGVQSPVLGMQLQKFGRTTQYTKGTILALNFTVSVSYGTNLTAEFTDQILAGPMSQPGDSGSAVLSMDKTLVGLLFAGSDQSTILNPMEKVFSLLGLNL